MKRLHGVMDFFRIGLLFLNHQAAFSKSSTE